MKLRTKFQDEDFELGEIVDASIYYGGGGRVKVVAESTRGGIITCYFETLKGMNEMFEDYEEPKEWCYIDIAGEVKQGEGNVPEHLIEGMKQVGNYFETKEEAEIAVRKLRAWQRLKEKGFRFEGWEDLQAEMGIDDLMLFNRDVINTDNVIGFRMDDYHDCIQDLNTCFGGEE